MREFKKIALSVYFTKKHCFPSKQMPKGKGYTKIQSFLWNLPKDFSVKEVLFKLATTYTIINPVLGLTPRSPLKDGTTCEICSDNDIETTTGRGMSTAQTEAAAYVGTIENKRNKFKLFCNDAMLDRIRLDSKLDHTQRSIGVGSSGKKLKEQVAAKAQSSKKRKQTGYKDDRKTKNKKRKQAGSKGTTVRVKPSTGRISSPRCVLCVATIGGAEASQTMYRCTTCGVHLCIVPKKNRRYSCFDKWHNVKDLSSLTKDATVTPKLKQKTKKSQQEVVSHQEEKLRQKDQW